MRIIMPTEAPKNTFEALEMGDIFIWCSQLYMKTEWCDTEDGPITAINLHNGGLEVIDDNDIVEKMNGELKLYRA